MFGKARMHHHKKRAVHSDSTTVSAPELAPADPVSAPELAPAAISVNKYANNIANHINIFINLY